MRQTSQPSISLNIPARVAIVAAFFGVDRLTKFWAIKCLKPLFLIQVFPFFRLVYVENTGMAFGLGHQRNRLFLALSTVLLFILIYLQKAWEKKNLWVQVGLLLVLSGALGNICDRILYAHVVDFLDLRLFSCDVFDIFNFADSCVSVGAVCLGIGIWMEEAEEKERGKTVNYP